MTTKRSFSVMVIFPILGGLAIGGLGVQRFINEQFLNAGFDFVIGGAFLSISVYTYLTGKEKMARYVSAFLSVMGPLAFLRQFDGIYIYWVYSSAIILFYLLNYRWALAMNLIMLAGIAYLVPASDFFNQEFYSILVTLSLIISFSLIFALNEERSKHKLHEQSVTDALTGVGNRRAFVEKVTEVVTFHKRHHMDVSLLYVDIDRFKQVNDKKGHIAGDLAIKNLAQSIQTRLRQSDSVFRIGGDEFVVIAEGANLNDATQLAEEIRTKVETTELVPNASITISMGVAALHDVDTPDSWIARADCQLYEAKNKGRNQIMVEAEVA